MLVGRSLSDPRPFTGSAAAFRGRLLKQYSYNPQTGKFYHASGFWRRKEAGALNARGYRHILFEEKLWTAARLSWIAATGTWPPPMIGFRNKNKDDARITNLYERVSAKRVANNQRWREACLFSGLERLARHANVKGLPYHLSTLSGEQIEAFT